MLKAISNSGLLRMKYKLLFSSSAAVLMGASVAFGQIPPADARMHHHHYQDQNEDQFGPGRAPGSPLLAVVGLAEQRISIYDAKGKIMESPVSSGQTGYETPAGIYSIVQKEEEHHSNLYDDASMPFMERITWTGMALHAGVLPGYAASHGCVRLPLDFAERLYSRTSMGMRVIVARQEIAPAEVPQPFMFNGDGEKPAAPKIERSRYSYSDIDDDLLAQLKRTNSDKSLIAQSEARKARDAKFAAQKSAAEAAAAAKNLQAAEANLAKANADVKAVEDALEKAAPDKAAPIAAAKDQALARLNAVQAQADTAKAASQSKAEAAQRAQADAKAADAALSLALEASEEARLNLAPVSVFISRKTMRLYVRKGNYPVYEGAVMIADPGKPIGSFVFTALGHNNSGDMRWNVVSLYKDATHIEPFQKEKQSAKGRGPAPAPAPADVAGAEAALSRLTLTDESSAIISEAVLPGSSLIISDEGPSIETGKDTDFVVFMSGEPQGGIAVRAHHHEVARREFRGGGGWFGGDWWGGSPSWGGRGDGGGRTYRQRGGGGGGWGGGGGGWFPF